ncbi:MAG: branched-chain amino acid ABC transporter permease [Streptosporangiaceae bacterium]|jgi:branched-chain amino acid transport system permease protein|nr:branched-chain amino acid ABC transporter permease [Actinomycetota bacterium]
MTLLRHVLTALVAGVVLFLLATRLSAYRDYQMAEIAAYVVAVAGLTVLIGISGQISIGQGAFMAVGAYATALILQHQAAWPIWLVLIVATLATALAGAIVGIAAARLRGPYLAGVTLMLAVALPSVAEAYQSVLGGDQGLPVAATVPGFLGVSFPLTRWQAWLGIAAALVVLVLLANLMRSGIGRNWRAIRDDEVAASLAGLNVARLKVLAFIVSAACAGLGGALFGVVTTIASPGAFTLTLSIGLLTAAVIGGLGSLAGAIWGSLLLVLVPSYLSNVASSHGLSSAASSSVPIAAYGLVLIAVMLAFPGGIQGALRRLLGPTAPAATTPLSALRRHASASDHKEESKT